MRELTKGEVRCSFCGASDFEVLRTYKIDWHLCKQCHNADRENRGDIFWERPFPNLLFRLGLPIAKRIFSRISEMLLKNTSLAYDSYGDITEERYVSGGWKKDDDDFFQFLSECKIFLDGKSVLTISDGPGFFAARVKTAKRVLTTEFEWLSVMGMRDRGIEVIKFDLNTDDLEEVCDYDKFDYVFFRSGIEFAIDIPEFLESLSSVMHEKSIGIISTHHPTQGVALEFMYDDYMLWHLLNPETVSHLLSEAGFEITIPYGSISNSGDIRESYRKPNLILNGIRRLFQIYYKVVHLRKLEHWTRGYMTSGNWFVFQKREGLVRA